MAWTPRAIRAYSGILLAQVLIGVLTVFLLGPAGVLIPILFTANLADLSLGFLWYLERNLSMKFVRQAQQRLAKVKPTVVAITGSYGKTSTKGYVAHIVGASHSTMASPASFNNLMGLSRTINEHLVAGTSVFVAEMGMNAEGRIRELTNWFPRISPLLRSSAKHTWSDWGQRGDIPGQIRDHGESSVVVLPVDQKELRALADKCERQGKEVIRVSAQGKKADVIVDPDLGTITYGPGASPRPMDMPPFGHAVNVAVALGIAWKLEVPLDQVLSRVAHLPVAAHRAEVATHDDGVAIIDDTYNSNPSGAKHAVESAARLAKERKAPLVVVTPGMVELGPVQVERNSQLAASVVKAGGTLVVVGRTNRKALVKGAGGKADVFDTRGDAVTHALQIAGDQGVILYENDLPDHYP